MKSSDLRGFTLIELMVVVAIISVLSALAIPSYMRFQARSKQAEAKSNLKALYTAERVLFQDRNTFACAILGTSSTCTASLAWAPERGNRYAYSIVAVPTGWQSRATGVTSNPAAGAIYDGIAGDVFAFPSAFKVGGNVSTAGQQV